MQNRFEMRRSVNIPVEVISTYWDEPVLLDTFDMSPGGAYFNCDCLPEPGEYVVCSFSAGDNKYDFFGQVVRSNLMRRTEESGEAGFGVQFLDTKPLDRIRIREHLRNSEIPPLPVMRKVTKDTKVVRRR
ncbi:MAG: PilZ domain-containing protein [Deltaproteobacteria bacterium]|nr:PilZ domain-containing protein [Deltaproteobacteria bacterium]